MSHYLERWFLVIKKPDPTSKVSFSLSDKKCLRNLYIIFLALSNQEISCSGMPLFKSRCFQDRSKMRKSNIEIR